MPPPRDVMAIALSGLVLIVGVVAAIVVLGQPSNQCDNMAGTCIRGRQQAAIAAVRFGMSMVALIGAAALWAALKRRRLPAAVLAMLVLAGAASIAVLATDPIPHLNNRWHGWLR